MADVMQTFAAEYAAYGYPVLFLGVLLENMGIPVPGETAVLVAGFLCSPIGGGHFHLAWVIGLTVIAAIIGDNLGFWIGHRWARPKLCAGRRFLFLTPKALALAEDYFHRYGLWTIFFARFITGLRVVGAVAAGTAGMPWPRFLVANASGAVAWAVTMALLGYFFGHSLELLHKYLTRGGLVLLGCGIVLVALPYLLRRLRHMESRPLEKYTRGQIIQGALVAVLEMICIGMLAVLATTRETDVLDRDVANWAANHPSLATLAVAGHYIGALPGVTLLTLLMLAQLWYAGRPGRESILMLWALVASEGVGLLLVGMIHARDVRPVYVEWWPYGYAGLVPMRALAVLGMMAYLLGRQRPAPGWLAKGVAVLLVLLAAFSVIGTGTQTFTETLLELAAGGLVLFAGMWWLEGYGPEWAGPVPTRESVRPLDSCHDH